MTAAISIDIERGERALLTDALAKARREGAIALVALDLPRFDPSLALGLSSKTAFVFENSSGLCAGIGAVRTLRTSGANAMEEMGALVSATVASIAPSDGLVPALYGGFAFAPGSAREEPWSEFGDARFVLPRIALKRRGDRTHAELAMAPDDDLETVVRGIERVRRELARPSENDAMPRLLSYSRPDAAAAADNIEAIRALIRSGAADKIVASHRAELEFASAIDPALALRRLALSSTGSTSFGFRFEESTFFGATPERLVLRRGNTVITEALAGSIPRERSDAHAELLASIKDRGEHTVVIDDIIDRLSGVCARVTVAPLEIKELPHVLHLRTPIEGVLRDRTDALALAARLHPTPAIGGRPRELATRWISERERPRGWYGGPLGWVDANGDGEFVVALRSGLVFGRRAWVYAGGGIMEDSEPRLEYAEAELKRRLVLDALGVERE
jgi:menaquinone-specific isochorismate synthase